MTVDDYVFAPARGGILPVDGPRPSTPLLRTAARAEVEPGRAVRLLVFEGVDADGVPPDRDSLPGPLRAAFDACVAELAGAPVPELRAAWARPGWHAQVEAWAGMALEQVRVWPLSAVLRNEGVWFKAVVPLFHHEPAVTAAIGAPRVLRVDHERGWMLMEGVEADGEHDHHAALRALAAVHRAWTTRIEEALALGAPDRRSPSVLPHTLVHGDFHRWNVIGSTIIDWSDAAVGNPLYDVNHYLLNVDDELRGPLIDTYAEAWPGLDVRAAADACEAETYEYVARSYATIAAALPPDELWWFAEDEAWWLARASDVRAGRRPSRDT